ncbi:MAG TPA: SDR family NAD(P)-dependent oxidoreductase [Anaeromyxobacter sp.]|nr:SDR family NAD(P)-dependent oxidoreductase [Anaeromyxobacter sp.]
MTSTLSWPSFSAAADPLDELVLLSRYFGSDPEMVLAGGGNTSVKVGDRLLVKGSGSALATIGREGFVAMDRRRLEALAAADLPAEREPREAAYKQALYAARLEPERNQRPSVEALLHHLVPGRLVVHGHATVANALTCSTGGEALAREILGGDVLWVPFVDPGFELARALRTGLAVHQRERGRPPRAVLMANHGIIVAGDAPEVLRENAEWLREAIARRVAAAAPAPWSAPAARRADADAQALAIAPFLRGLLAEGSTLPVVALEDGPEALAFAASPAARAVTARGPLSPDQIVYCNSFPLWFEAVEGEEEPALLERLRAAVTAHRESTGYPPKPVIVPGVGIFCAGDDVAGARNCRLLYLDAVRVMTGAARLGGVQALSEGHRRFIETWEVEAYRKQIARAGRSGRASGRVAVVTGAAQGFGLEIAQSLAAEGGTVALADVNQAGVRAAALAVEGGSGPGRTLGVAVDVTDGGSVAAMIREVVRAYGGLDVLVSNAGVLRAGSVKTQSEQEFDFVTAVNYKGYFLCVKHAAPVMARQHAARPSYRSDVVQINSKSGLSGSNRNGAYAGSKFGGIGLTQSFALELVEDGIKVNSVCPGNFFDGPLWSDPRTGLFVQYLAAGKVPGARTVEEVRRFYEAKVPMKRGCRSADVMRAVFYLIEQEYETGQALPVTGGQEMLK